MIPLAQPPRKDDRSFDDWMYRLWKRIASTAGIAWGLIDKTGANLTDIPTRHHDDLQYIPTSPVLMFDNGDDGQDGMIIVQNPQTIANYAGTYTLPTITDNGNGTVTLGSGDYCFCSDASGSLPILKFTISGATYSLTDQSMNYITAIYNGSTPTLVVQTNNSTHNETTIYTVVRIARNGTHLDIIDRDQAAKALPEKLLLRVNRTQNIEVEPGGFILGEAATRLVTMTSGVVWNGVQRISENAFNSSIDALSIYYHVAGIWTKASITQYNNTQYDDGTNLQTTPAGKYVVNWIFREANSQGTEEGLIVLGNAAYNLTQAQSTIVPANLPFEISGAAFLIGRIIVQQGATTATQIDSVANFPTTFAQSTIATGLASATTNIDVSASPAPVTGQQLVATSPTTAVWQSITPVLMFGNDGEDGQDGISIPGIQGAQGIQGIQGPSGVSMVVMDGEEGPEGMPIQGSQGIQGIQGIAGTNGLNGSPGSAGFSIDGQDGDDGFPIPGNQGSTGPQGMQGIAGTSGLTGPSGNDGEDGDIGYIMLNPTVVSTSGLTHQQVLTRVSFRM